MAHFEEVEVVAIMPAEPMVYSHALGSDGRVYAFIDDKWHRMRNRQNAWVDRVNIVDGRKIYQGKFMIKAWVEGGDNGTL